MLVGALIAVGSAVVYGVSDFYGAVGSARIRLIPSTTVAYAVAAPVSALALLIGGRWSWDAVLWGGLAAILATMGMLAFYAAMVAGPVSLVSPLLAVLDTAVPVGFGVAFGERLGWVTWGAVGLAVAAGVVMAVPPRGAAGEAAGVGSLAPRTIALTLFGGITLGLSIVCLDLAPSSSGVVPAFVETTGQFVVMAVVAAATWRTTGPWLRRPRLFAPSLANGALWGVANALIVLALQHGDLAVAGVLINLYPISTLVLAWFVTGERLSGLQFAGVGAALAASAMFALP